MNSAPCRRIVPASFALAFVASLTLLSGCNPSGNSGVEAASTPAPAVVQEKTPTEARVIERARARWADIEKADWIAAYAFLTPEMKKRMPLANYLPGKSNHKYENPAVDNVLKLDVAKKEALVRTHVLWTPMNPEVKRVKLEPGQTLTEEVPMVETWRWVKDDWYFFEQKSSDEFFEKHPELLRADKLGNAAPVQATDPAQKPEPPKK